MSIFEFVLIVVSLVLAIGFTGLLREISSIIRNRDSVTQNWLPIVWIATLFLYTPGYWWSLWDFRDVEWTFPEYFFLLLTPTCLYIALSLLVESDTSNQSQSRTERFEEVRIPFFAVFTVGHIVASWDGWILSVAPFFNPLRGIQIAMMFFFIAGIISSHRVVQQFIAVASLVVLVVAMFGLRYLPGAFGPG